MRDILRTASKFLKKYESITAPAMVVKDLIGAVQFVAPFLLTLFGLEEVLSISVDLSRMSLPVRLLVVIVGACVLGAGLGFAVALLTRRNSTPMIVVSGLLSIGWALMLVTIIETMAGGGRASALPEYTLFVLVGLGLMLWVLTFQLRAQTGFGNRQMVTDRSLVVLIVTGSALLSSVLVQVGAAA